MKILIVVDMQYDFVTGPLGSKEAVKCVEPVRRKIDNYRKEGENCRIIYTKDTHGADYLSTQEGRKLPVEHCIKGTPGWEIIQDLYVPGSTIIEKPSFGSFDLADSIAQNGTIESIELIGVCTDICVISNALILKARFPEVPVSVDSGCCAGITPESHQKALDTMRMCQIEIF